MTSQEAYWIAQRYYWKADLNRYLSDLKPVVHASIRRKPLAKSKVEDMKEDLKKALEYLEMVVDYE